MDFLPFCSRDRNRNYLSSPFVIGGFTYATDGRVAVRVPGEHGVPATEKMPHSIVGMFDEAEARSFRPFVPVEAPAIERELCFDCRGMGYIAICEVCEGEGEHTCDDNRCVCEHQCGACDGKGVFPARKNDDRALSCEGCSGDGRREDRRGVDLGEKLSLQWNLLQRVQKLPGPIEWAPLLEAALEGSFTNYAPTAFRGPGWVALIMPRRWSGHEEIKAVRLEGAMA